MIEFITVFTGPHHLSHISKVLQLVFALICGNSGFSRQEGLSYLVNSWQIFLGRCSVCYVTAGSMHKQSFTSSEMTPLPAKPFNYFSVLAYLVIGVGYLVYICYHSARRKGGRRSSFSNVGTRQRQDLATTKECPKARYIFMGYFVYSSSSLNYQGF